MKTVEYNILNPLEFSKTKRLIITLIYGPSIFILPMLFVFITPFNPNITGIISISLLLILFAFAKPIEDGFLHKMEIIGKVKLTDDFLVINEKNIDWKEISHLNLKPYLKSGYRSTVSHWKISYTLDLKTKSNLDISIIIGKYAIKDHKLKVIEELRDIRKLSVDIRKKLK